ncbi:MAG: VOC family protein [Pseudomonadota bacterium]
MAELTQITPFIMTHDLKASLAFFTEVLGFTCGFKMENYAFVRRKGGALRVIEVEKSCEIGEQMVYLDCDDVDALYATLKPQLDTLGESRVRAPFDQPYQQREFHVKDPDNCLLLFGMDIRPSP